MKAEIEVGSRYYTLHSQGHCHTIACFASETFTEVLNILHYIWTLQQKADAAKRKIQPSKEDDSAEQNTLTEPQTSASNMTTQKIINKVCYIVI